MQHEKNDMVHNMFIHFFRFFCYTFKLNKNIFGQKIVYVNVKYMVINKIKSVGLSYCDFVSKIKCSNWWKLMYNIFFSVNVCMNQALDYFGYFMSLPLWL